MNSAETPSPETQTPLLSRRMLLQNHLKNLLPNRLFAVSVFGTFGIRIGAMIVAFLTSIVLARLLGSVGYGEYIYAMSWVTIMSTAAVFGIDKLAVRAIAQYHAENDWAAIRGYIRVGSTTSFFLAVILASLTLIIIPRALPQLTPSTLNALRIAVLAVPLIAMTRIQQAIVRGLHAIVTGQIAEIFVRPLLFVILLLVFSYAVSSAANALWLNLVASLVAFLMAFILLRRNLSTELLHHESRYELRLWLSAALPFMLVAVLEVVNNRLDLLMLGSMRGPEAAGILNVSKRLAELTTFALLSVNITLAPSIAKLHMQEKSDDLQQLVTKSSRLILLGTLPITLFLLIFGIPLLSLWGETYQVGYSTLVILCLAQLLNAFMGPVALILNMTGRERYVALSLAVTLLLNYGLNMLLIPTYSFTGAAVATATAVLCWNVLMALWVYRTLGVYTPSLGSRFFRTLQHHA